MAKEIKRIDSNQPTVGEAKMKKSNIMVYNGSKYSALDLVRITMRVESVWKKLTNMINELPDNSKYQESLVLGDSKTISKIAKETCNEPVYEVAKSLTDSIKKLNTVNKEFKNDIAVTAARIENHRRNMA